MATMRAMPKARKVRAALEKRLREKRRRGSHSTFDLGGGEIAIFAYHDGRELSEREPPTVANDVGMTLEEIERPL
jgi:hypothetical protein